jgi:hypothetical protein
MLNTDITILDVVEIQNQRMNGLKTIRLKHDGN